MEIKPEIQELFDKFQGGKYSYEKDNYSLTAYNIHRITNISVRDAKTNIVFAIDFFRGQYSALINGRNIEGNMLYVSNNVINLIQDMIISAKHYFEENGFDINKFNESVANELEKSKKEVDEFELKRGTVLYHVNISIYLKHMERISNEKPSLYWK